MTITCTSCGHLINFKQNVNSYSVFVCPKCSSLHYKRGEEIIKDNQYKQVEPEGPLAIKLNDTFKYQSSIYTIVNISEKRGMNGNWWEYGGIDSSGNWVFFSFSEGFKKSTYLLKEFSLPQNYDINRSIKLGATKFKKRYVYDYLYTARTSYATGVFYYDPRTKVTYFPFYAEEEGEETFLSIEQQDNELYAFLGKPVTLDEIYRMFEEKRGDHKEQYKQHFINLYKLGGLILLSFLLVFLIFNYKGLFFKNEVNYTKGVCSRAEMHTNYRCIFPFIDWTKIKSNELTIEGSIHSKTHTSIQIQLINTTTKRVVYSNAIKLNNNYMNNASAINILVKNIDPGNYEFVAIAKTASSSANGLDLEIDIKYTAGQIVNTTPLVIVLVLVAILLIIMHNRLAKNYTLNKPLTIGKTLLIDSYIYCISIVLIGIGYFSYELYSTNFRGTSVETLEDADYIGQSNSHYVHRTYSNHK